MRELSIFVDESGDFGEYDFHSPYYIITMIFHDQENSIEKPMAGLDRELRDMGLIEHCVHTGPIIRGEEEYRYMDLQQRRKIFNKMIAFIRKCEIKYHCFYIEKKHIQDMVEATGKLSKSISIFIRENYDMFSRFDNVKVYYDNGQVEVNKILSSVFHVMLPEVEFRKVLPSDYRLFQVADLLCTMELLRLKKAEKRLSRSEVAFFGNNERDFRINYLKPLNKKMI